jgi:hypothetical protein
MRSNLYVLDNCSMKAVLAAVSLLSLFLSVSDYVVFWQLPRHGGHVALMSQCSQ